MNIFQPTITGSLNMTGSGVISGSLSLTGDLIVSGSINGGTF
jgi:hypothetical protein